MKSEDIDNMLNDSMQLLKKNGKIIMLTPTGAGNFLKLTKHFFSLKNKGIYIWYRSTKKRAKLWMKTNYLKQYASKNQLHYESQIVMEGFAQLEIITA
ncbi:MAG TPA: hypothetical protein ENJ53_01845 [Phaeodactylibacter sp.]|nr:hypothetical protein [Phaeodactylibacter sp.]